MKLIEIEIVTKTQYLLTRNPLKLIRHLRWFTLIYFTPQ